MTLKGVPDLNWPVIITYEPDGHPIIIIRFCKFIIKLVIVVGFWSSFLKCNYFSRQFQCSLPFVFYPQYLQRYQVLAVCKNILINGIALVCHGGLITIFCDPYLIHNYQCMYFCFKIFFLQK